MSSASSGSPLLRVVFDANVYMAAVLRPGLSEELVRRGFDRQFTVIASDSILAEVRRKLESRSGIPPSHLENLLQLIDAQSVSVETVPVRVNALRDPDDLHILGCAKAGQADLIVSLDQDLLELKEWEGIRILHPKTFRWIVPPPEGSKA